MEKVSGARHATTLDHNACSQALLALHNVGIIDGDVNKHNFLIGPAGVTLIDFKVAWRTNDKAAFEAEMQSLKGQSSDTSGRGGSEII